AGPNGGGKSTLLKALLGVVPTYTRGTLTGKILYQDKPVSSFNITSLAGQIGIVLQDPETQISNLSVWEETTFGAGNLLFTKDDIIANATDALQHVGIIGLRDNMVFSLSGGQLQRLSIASLLAMKPKVLILDEPLTNLDPIGVASVTKALQKIRNFVDIMVIATHWLDPFLSFATRLVVLSKGELALDIPVNKIGMYLPELTHAAVEIPQLVRIEQTLKRQHIASQDDIKSLRPVIDDLGSTSVTSQLVSAKYLGYRYPKGSMPLDSVTFDIGFSQRIAIVGHNGEGKTTLANLLLGLRKPTKGKLQVHTQKFAYLLQKPTLGFLTTNVVDEIAYGGQVSSERVTALLRIFNLGMYIKHSPFELSGGEQRRLALAVAFSSSSDLMVLDEPTAGLDSEQFGAFVGAMTTYTGTSVYITHDPRLVGNYVRQVLVLGKGMLLLHGSTAQLTREMLEYLGYPHINPTVSLACRFLSKGIPMIPEELEVQDATRLSTR
ncbi:MAG TPA: ATP-binding cassette domain-containing protein, partial [Candidatus Saccharimonadales bacterium]|nr:ATP-binding cassette domain-containing protein [Candidatus Saccharimonadales bacterium]